MTDLRKAAEMALEALHNIDQSNNDDAIEALCQALAEPEQEPVAWVIEDGEVDYYVDVVAKIKPGTPLYTAPPKKEWVGLTRRELDIATLGLEDLGDCYLAIEAKLKEKNT